MKKKIVLMKLVVIQLVSCMSNNDRFLINEGYGVDTYKLRVKVTEQPVKKISGIEMKIGRDSLVHAIDIMSSNYYTNDSLKVGVHYASVIKSKGMYDKTPVLYKGNYKKRGREFPKVMRYDGIMFFLDDKGFVEKIRIH